jgi:hypothetical protein
MISPITGEVVFSDGLCFLPHRAIVGAPASDTSPPSPVPTTPWIHRYLGPHPSEHGTFEVETVIDAQHRVLLVLLSHAHDFYQADTPGDTERRIYHESVLRRDLQGQQDFSWGRAYCRFDDDAGKDWLVVLYAPGPVPHMIPHPSLFFIQTAPNPNQTGAPSDFP